MCATSWVAPVFYQNRVRTQPPSTNVSPSTSSEIITQTYSRGHYYLPWLNQSRTQGSQLQAPVTTQAKVLQVLVLVISFFLLCTFLSHKIIRFNIFLQFLITHYNRLVPGTKVNIAPPPGWGQCYERD